MLVRTFGIDPETIVRNIVHVKDATVTVAAFARVAVRRQLGKLVDNLGRSVELAGLLAPALAQEIQIYCPRRVDLQRAIQEELVSMGSSVKLCGLSRKCTPLTCDLTKVQEMYTPTYDLWALQAAQIEK